jgi:hypothetical protein
MVKIMFCEGHKTRCAIYKVAEIVSIGHVPDDILPIENRDKGIIIDGFAGLG